MNADQRLELDAIRLEQRDLQRRLRALETRLEHFGQQAEDAERAPAVAEPLTQAMPPPLPVAPPRPVRPATIATVPTPAVEAVSPPPVAPAVAPRESLEMQIGTTWLVRVGVILMLTGLAWMGSHLYHHIVPILGPAAKVALLYLGAGALTGIGAWLERSRLSAELGKLRDYARVVFAGGLAAVYYVTYAAHSNPHLRVFPDPLLAGALLLGWAAFMVWLADRRGSELLATFSVLLGFYTSAVNEIGGFTLTANLFLAGGAVYLLRRQLWQIFPYVSLLATFGSYGFWRFSHGYIEGALTLDVAPPHLALTPNGFWLGSGFLLLYWLLFTWAAFTADERALPAWLRAGFVTVNNGAFYLLTTWLLLAIYPGSFWRLSLGFGVVLLALAEASRRWSRLPVAKLEDAYAIQGALLATLGLVGYFTGWQLGLVLAVQSALLLWRAGRRTSWLRLGLAGALAAVSLIYTLDRAPLNDAPLLWTLGLTHGALLFGHAWWSQRLRAGPGPAELTLFNKTLAFTTPWFSLLGAVAWFWTIENAAPSDAGRALALAGAAVLLTASIYALRVPILPWLAQVFLSGACLHWWLAGQSRTGSTLPILGAALALGHWWQARRPTGNPAARFERTAVPAAWDAVLAVAVLGLWLQPHAPGGKAGWMAEASALSLAVLGYGLFTRYWALAAAGQLLLAAGIGQFFDLWDHPYLATSGERLLALAPALAMLVALVVARRLLPTEAAGKGRLGWAAIVYELVALLMILCWVGRYVPLDLKFVTYCFVGAVIFGLGCLLREKRWLLLSFVPTAFALLVIWVGDGTLERRSWFTLGGVALLAGQQQFGKRWLRDDAPAFFPAKIQGAFMTAAVFCAWTFLTARMGRWEGSAFTLAASWSLFAPVVFAAGLVLRERVYRWLGLLILAATLGHILLFDVSRLDSLGRAISALVLGIVVLGLGYFYNRYQAKIRDLLQ